MATRASKVPPSKGYTDSLEKKPENLRKWGREWLKEKQRDTLSQRECGDSWVGFGTVQAHRERQLPKESTRLIHIKGYSPLKGSIHKNVTGGCSAMATGEKGGNQIRGGSVTKVDLFYLCWRGKSTPE